MALKESNPQAATDNAATQAHQTDTTTASRYLLEDAKDLRAASPTPITPDQERNKRNQVSEFNRSLQDAGLLPALTLTLADEQFQNIDGKSGTGRDNKIDIEEVRAAGAAAEARNPGSLDGMLYGELYQQMKNGTMPSEMTQEQLRTKLDEINTGFQRGDKQNALEVAKMLTDTPNLLTAIDEAGKDNRHDGVIGKDDIDAYLKRTDLDPTVKKNLDWLSKNWNDSDLNPLKNDEKYLNLESLNNGRAALENDLASTSPEAVQQRAANAAKIAKINSTPEAQSLKAQGYILDPNDNGHDEVYRTASGKIVAIDRDAQTGEPIAFTYGDGTGKYQGVKRIQDESGDRWDYYDGTADSAGKLTVTKTVPSVRQNGSVAPDFNFQT